MDRKSLLRQSHAVSSTMSSFEVGFQKKMSSAAAADHHRDLIKEIMELLSLAAAFFVASVSWVGMKATDTALLGHVGTRYLDASAFSDLYTSSTGVFIGGQILGVFCSQAYGAGNYGLVGTWLKVSYVVLGLIGVPVMIAWLMTNRALQLFGVRDQQTRSDAALYATILAISIPAQIGFGQLSQFFSSQQIMTPSYIAAPAALLVNLLAGIAFVVGVPGLFRGFGFVACPSVTTSVEYFQFSFVVIVFCVWKKLHLTCAPEVGFFSTRDVTRSRIVEYFLMYIPAALASASDFWRMSVVGALAAQLSRDDLGVFNASYRVMWLSLVFALSLGMAIGNKLGVELGSGNAHLAVRMVKIGLTTAAVVVVVIACVVASAPRKLGQIFTSDPVLLSKFEDCRFGLAFTVLFMNLGVVLERVPIACGKTSQVLACGFVGSWFGQVPFVILAMTYWQRTLNAVYAGVATGYALLCVLYTLLIVRTDFTAVAREARLRSGASNHHDDDDDTLL